MAKKSLASLMVGIMGDEPAKTTEPEVSSTPTPEVVEETPAEADIQEVAIEENSKEENSKEENPESTRRRRVGRPRKGETPVKSDEIRATFIVDPAQMKKIKYISLAEGNLLKETLYNALEQYIADWEEENGRIKLPGKK
ncbi:MAG: hypothetical protein NC097_05410 [Clostridium sp.]|nr:hypothetical protein [Prevotella sp.]MCM1429215.1 hypothetical protein [Clostridium sp.]MCM1475812.1 hypothetical protein [Muribaculaceae bacterium]